MQEGHYLSRTKTSLQETLSWYTGNNRHWNTPPNPQLQAEVREDIQSLKTALGKINHNIFHIAAFGLVSRGKSSVINALLGEKILSSGPLNGVTQWPRSIRWTPPSAKVQIEFIDTPGLDEIAGESRTAMAESVASEADLILFIVAGDITRTEYQALSKLLQSKKPLLLVFNKIDLYPEIDQEAIYQQLKALGLHKAPLVNPSEIVCIAAEPTPISVLVEGIDGKVTEEIETPPPQIEALKLKILQILNREGKILLALNALIRARDAQLNIARKTLEIKRDQAETLIWKYARYKALAVALNPIAIVDVLGGIIADLALIRALASLYGLPITSHRSPQLWRKILINLGSLSLGELLSLGLSKMMVGIGYEGVTDYVSSGLLQAGIATYGTYLIGKAAQEYLELGSTWSPSGTSKMIEEIFSAVSSDTLVYRLKATETKHKIN